MQDTHCTHSRPQKHLVCFIGLYHFRCGTQNLPELVNVHAVQLVGNAGYEGVLQIVRSFVLWREFPRPGLYLTARWPSSRCRDDTATAGSWWRGSGEPLRCYRSSSPGI